MKLNLRNRVISCFIKEEKVLETQRLVKTTFCEINSFEKKYKNNITKQLCFHFIYFLLFNLQINIFLQ